MNLNDIRNLNKKQLLAILGLQVVPSVVSVTAKIIGFIGIGVVAGATVALLASPKTGREVRHSLRRTLRNGIDEVLDVLPDKLEVPLPRGA
jgi:hypothetical protein